MLAVTRPTRRNHWRSILENRENRPLTTYRHQVLLPPLGDIYAGETRTPLPLTLHPLALDAGGHAWCSWEPTGFMGEGLGHRAARRAAGAPLTGAREV